jgi:glycine/D-amino acid oxidase-like deaminating enzyme
VVQGSKTLEAIEGEPIAACLRFFPILSGVHAIRTWAGLRPYTPDLLPISSG